MAIINVTPIMTSYNTPTPYVISYSSFVNGYALPVYAFNENENDYWECATGRVAGEYLEFDFGNNTLISSVVLGSQSGHLPCNPKRFDILGSNDKKNYTTLLSPTNEINWTANEERTYELPDVVNYRHYKLLVHENSGEVAIRLRKLAFLLDTSRLNKYIILDNGIYKTIQNETYKNLDNFELSLDNINTSGFSDLSLMKNFSQLSKSFQIFSAKNSTIHIRGLKTNSELVVSSDVILWSIAQNIDYFKLETLNIGNAVMKIVLSVDKGVTWKTWNTATSSFEDLACTIPVKNFDTLTPEELAQWNSSKDVILENGISVETFNSLDFNLLKDSATQTFTYAIKFAYVISRPSFEDNIKNNTLSWKYDAKGSMRLMKDSEFQVDVYGRNVKYTSFIENPLMKVNVMV